MSRVTAACISPRGTIERLVVGSGSDIEKVFGRDVAHGEVDLDYNRELGVNVFYLFAPQLRRAPNVFPSWIMQGYYEGPVVIVSDCDEEGNRDSERWRKLGDYWFAKELANVVRICNTSPHSIALVQKQRPY